MFSIRVDTKAFDLSLDQIAREQIPFAISKAINATALNIQDAERAHMHKVFKVRRPQFIDRAVKIKPFATKTRPTAVISIDPPGGQARADILTKFEKGGQKRPRSGQRIAIPIDARRTKSDIVAASQRLKAFNFRGTGNVLKGDKRTFMIRHPGGRGLVLQRVGKGKRSRVRILYMFKPNVPIRPLLQFTSTVTRVFQERFGPNFLKAWLEATTRSRHVLVVEKI